MASIDQGGYDDVVRRQDLQEMLAFLRRMLHHHNLPEVPEAHLETLARQHLKVPSGFEELLHQLRSYASQSPSTSSGAGPAQALHGYAGGHLATEVVIDGRNLVAQAVEDSGVLAIVAPPWSLRYVFGPRIFQLVIRNLADPSRGLVICEGPDEARIRSMATEIAGVLGVGVALLGQAKPTRRCTPHRRYSNAYSTARATWQRSCRSQLHHLKRRRGLMKSMETAPFV